MPTKHELDNWFTYHAPRPDQILKYQAIREAARYFASVILSNTPESPDQSAAIRSLRECVMTANASIACEEPMNTMGLTAAPDSLTPSGEELEQVRRARR